jgi:tetratricopeptide (TPR) repeat protein
MGNWWEDDTIDFGGSFDEPTTYQNEDQETASSGSGSWFEDDDIEYGVPLDDENVSEIQYEDPNVVSNKEDISVQELPEEVNQVAKEQQVEQPKEKSFWKQMVDPYVKGAKQAFYGIGEMGASLISGGATMMPEGMLGKEYLQKLGDAEREIWDVRKKAEDANMPEYDKNLLDDFGMALDPGYWVYNGVKQLPILAAGIAGGPAAAGFTGGGLIYSQTYNDLLDKGVTPEKAVMTGAVNSVIGGLFESLGTKYVLEGGKLAIRSFRGGAGEAATEAAQTLQGDLFSKATELFDKGKTTHEVKDALIEALPEMVWEAGGAGATGFGLGVGGGFIAGGKTEEAQDVERTLRTAKMMAAEEAGARVRNAQEVRDKKLQDAPDGEKAVRDAELLLQQPSLNVDPKKGPESPNAPVVDTNTSKIHITDTGEAFREVRDAQGNLVQRNALPTGKDFPHLAKNSQVGDPVRRSIPYKIRLAEHINTVTEEINNGVTPLQAVLNILERNKTGKSAEESAAAFEQGQSTYRMDLIDQLIDREQISQQEGMDLKAKMEGGVSPSILPPKPAAESAEVLSQIVDPYKDARDSAAVMEQEFAKREQEGLDLRSQMEGGVAPAAVGPKSAEESAKVFEQEQTVKQNNLEGALQFENNATMIVDSLTKGEVDVKTATDSLIKEEAKSAEESGEVFQEDRQEFLDSMDKALALEQQGQAQEAIAELKRAVKRKGKNAEKSAAVVEKAITPAKARLANARADYGKALASNDQDAINAATQELSLALQENDIEEGRADKTPEVAEVGPEDTVPVNPRAELEDDVQFDEDQRPVKMTKSAEDVAIAREEAQKPQEELLEPIETGS